MTSNVLEVVDMLTYQRPAMSKAEKKFIRRFILPLGIKRDGFGNCHKIVGDDPKVLWSCHTDTVHKTGGRQKVVLSDSVVSLAPGQNAKCLGGDDTAGVWLMRQMILAGVPGHYIFHRSEEIGGLGSNHIATREPHLIEGLELAIALDRKGDSSVITHQGLRTCSDEFALTLAAELGGQYEPDDSGLFTDTANYTDIIGECTNLSTGYYRAHSSNETQDLAHLEFLLDRLKSLDISKLVCVRNPGEVEAKPSRFWSGYSNWNPDPVAPLSGKPDTNIIGSPNAYTNDDDYILGIQDDGSVAMEDIYRHDDMVNAVQACPEAAAELLLNYGAASDEIYELSADKDGYLHRCYPAA